MSNPVVRAKPIAIQRNRKTPALVMAGTRGAIGLPGLGLTDGDKGDMVVSGTGTVWALKDSGTPNAKLALMPAGTVKANLAGAAANPSDVGLVVLKAALGINSVDVVTALGFTPQASDADLSAIAALGGTGVPRRTGPNTWILDTSVPTGVTRKQLRTWAAANGAPLYIYTLDAAVPADIADAVNIGWNHGTGMIAGDALYTFIQATLGFSGAAMTAAYTAMQGLTP